MTLRKAGGAGLILFFFLVVACVSTYPLSVKPAGLIPDNADALLNAWAIAWDNHQLRRNPTEILHANIFHPDPAALSYSEPLLGEALLAAPILWLGGNDVLAFNVLLILTLVLSASAMFLLARELTGSTAAAILAGEIFAFTTANYDSVARIQIVSNQWTPLTLFFLVRVLRRRRLSDAVGLGLAFALQGLSCNYYQLYFATLLLFALPAFYLALPRPRNRNIPWRLLVTGALIALSLLAPFDLAQYSQFDRLPQVGRLRVGAQPADYFLTLPGNWLYGFRFGVDTVSYDQRQFLGRIRAIRRFGGKRLTANGSRSTAGSTGSSSCAIYSRARARPA